MSQQSNSPKSMTSGEALAIYRRVKMSGATVVYADATDHGIGVTQTACSSGDEVPIRLDTEGSSKVTVTGVIAAGGACYAANDGKVASTGTVELGKAVEASTALNDVIEFIPEADKAVSVSDVNVWISDYVWNSSDTVTNSSDIVVIKSDVVSLTSDLVLTDAVGTKNASDAKVAVSDALLAHAAGDWANVSDVKVTVAEIIAAMSDALI